MKTLIPASVLNKLPASAQQTLLSKTFFPNLISTPFGDGLKIAFAISVVLVLIAAVASALRGNRVIYKVEDHEVPVVAGEVQIQPEKVTAVSGSSVVTSKPAKD
jgi:hypothetical protein